MREPLCCLLFRSVGSDWIGWEVSCASFEPKVSSFFFVRVCTIRVASLCMHARINSAGVFLVHFIMLEAASCACVILLGTFLVRASSDRFSDRPEVPCASIHPSIHQPPKGDRARPGKQTRASCGRFEGRMGGKGGVRAGGVRWQVKFCGGGVGVPMLEHRGLPMFLTEGG